MQYATFEIQGRRLLLDADEYQALRQGTPIEETAGVEDEAAFHVCHGAYLPQPGTGAARALKDLLAARDHWLGCLAGNACRLLALEDIQPFEAVRQGRALAIPLAVLVRMDGAVAGRISPHVRGLALTCFLRYDNLTPAQNLLNRPGVIALKGPVRRIGPDAPGDWKSHVDTGRAVLTATDIFL